MRTIECLNELVEYWYEYDTERVKSYVQEERGWPAEMVDEFLIGWAAPNSNDYIYLLEQGYSKEEIISTGAFKKSGKSLWKGRYVFPYFNQDRDVEYAISRCTGEKGGGAAGYDGHRKDERAGKYAKLTKKPDYSNVDEIIWGQHTLSESTDSVIITEGIADAMAIDYADGSVLSPVTTSFKNKHYPPLISLCKDNGIDTINIIPDAEEVQDTTKYGVSAGIQGALTTAYKIYNRTNEIEVRVAELPRQSGEEKVDVDSYLASHSIEDLGSILKNAREATEFEAYEEIALGTTTGEYEDDFEGIKSENHSAIYDLTMVDVLPSNFNRRGKNPLGHYGTSTNYFVANSKSAYDHKRKKGYNALTYLLCKFGIRDVESPNGPLSYEEVYRVWANSKDSGIISKDDAIPAKAMKYVAKQLGHEPPEDDMLPREVYNDVIEEVDERIGSGREKLEQQSSSKEFYNDKSAYYKMSVEIVNTLCSAHKKFENFQSDEYMWTAKGVQGWVPSLALVAVEEEYISKDNINPRWASKLTDEQFADLCLDAQQTYMFGGKPPYRALLGVAKKNKYKLNMDGKLTTQSKQKAKTHFYT